MTQTIVTMLEMLQVFASLGAMAYGGVAVTQAITDGKRRKRRRLALTGTALVAAPIAASLPMITAAVLSAVDHGPGDSQTSMLVVMAFVQVLAVFAFNLSLATAAATVATGRWAARMIDRAAETMPTFSFSIDFESRDGRDRKAIAVDRSRSTP